MTLSKQNREYLLNFLMASNSLHDLLAILSNICENLDLAYLNPGIKHFKYFQFTFFGLMVKARGLLEMMIFRAELLKDDPHGFGEIFPRLLTLKKDIGIAYALVDKNKMLEGKDKIIQCAEEYRNIFEDVRKIGLMKVFA